MSKFWSWFIPFILIICILIFVLITKVNNNTNEYNLYFNDYLDGVKDIGNIGDKKVYSIYDINQLNNKDLSSYLSDDFIDELIDKMNHVDSLNDGGSAIYYSDNLANVPFYLIRCRTLTGNNDIYILNSMSVGYCRL